MGNSERMKRVSALAIQGKTDTSIIPELWNMVERLIGQICKRYCRTDTDNRLYDHDDLIQCSYFGFLKAIDTYDESRGAFSTYLAYFIRRACRREIGQDGRQSDPLYRADSLDKPLPHTEDDYSMADMLADPDAGEPFAIVEQDMLVDMILAEADRLPHPHQGRVIREHTYHDRPLEELAAEMGISRQGVAAVEERAIFYLRRRPLIRELYAEYQAEMQRARQESAHSPYQTKGTRAFKTDFTSIVEDIVMRLG